MLSQAMQIYARDHIEVHPQKKKEVLYLVKKKEQRNIMDIKCEVLLQGSVTNIMRLLLRCNGFNNSFAVDFHSFCPSCFLLSLYFVSFFSC